MPPRQQSALTIFMLILVVWLFLPEGDYQRSASLADIAYAQLAKYRDALEVLTQTHWGDFSPTVATRPEEDEETPASFVNLTGFRAEDGLAWEDLDQFRDKSLALSHWAIPPVDGEQLWDIGQGEPVWKNVSGIFRGEWMYTPGIVSRTPEDYNLSESVPSMDWIGDRQPWARNLTGGDGRVRLRLEANRTIESYPPFEEGSMEGPVSGGSIRTIKGIAAFEDARGSGHNWEMKLWGVHWPHQGVILMTTTSEKFQGIFGLPHLTPSEDFFRSSQQLLNKTLAGTILTKENNIFGDPTSPWNSDVENSVYTVNPSPHCEYIMYAQIHPPLRGDLGVNETELGTEALERAIREIEQELGNPQGAPVHKVPELKMSTVVWSPDCAFFLESQGPPKISPVYSDHLVGLKNEVHLHQIKSWLLVYALIMFGQVYLMKNQMRESYTPSTMGRVSFGTLSIIVVADGTLFTAAVTWVLSATSTFLPTMVLMFAAFLSMMLGGSFLAKIFEVQAPRTRNTRPTAGQGAAQGQRPSNTTPSAVTTTAPPPAPNPPTLRPDGSLLPIPVTATRSPPATGEPIIVPSDQDIGAEIAAAASAVPGVGTTTATTATTTAASPRSPPRTFQSVVGRYMLLSLCFSFLAISSTTWYPSIRSLFLNAFVLSYLSLWVPQIYRNTIRNCRRALSWPFVAGQSILRLLPVAYFWCKPDNFLYARPEPHAFILFCAWLWVQLVVLAAQDVVGPRFGVPRGWTPEAWDYHPVLREEGVESGVLPIGLMTASMSADENLDREGEKGHGRKRSDLRTIDCSICREILEVPVLRAGEEDSSVTGAFARRTYMVTPCRHIFHTACLEGWMRFRLQCPICREDLPPL